MTAVDIASLSLAEKLELMEALWASLDGQPEAVGPHWHEAALREAEATLADGTAQLVDWQEAKTRLRACAEKS